MKKVLAFLLHPILLRLYIALLAVLVVRLAVPVLELPRERWASVSWASGGIIFVILLITYFMAQRAAKKLAAGQVAPVAAPANSAEAMAAEKLGQIFQRAVAELNRRVPPKGFYRQDALYTLPWIMVIGPPGAGKSTALRNSDLSFVVADGSVDGISGTADCTWWFAETAVVLDTAGRYTIMPDSRHEWFSFLKLIRRYRPKRPIDAAIVQLSLEAFASSNSHTLQESASLVRARLDELMDQLQVRFPVYLVLSKCDRLEGFSELFSRLTPEERRSPWGFTLDVDDLSGRSVGEALREAFRELTRRLTVRSAMDPDLLALSPGKDAALLFSAELEALEKNLVSFVERAFALQGQKETPWLTTVFLNSASQEGEASSGVRSQVLSAAGLGRAQVRHSVASLPHFVSGVFHHVIEKTRVPVRPNASGRRRRFLELGSVFAIAMAIAFFGSCRIGGVYVERVRVQNALMAQATILKAQHQVVDPEQAREAAEAILKAQDAILTMRDDLVEFGLWETGRDLLLSSVESRYLLALRKELNSSLARVPFYDPRKEGDEQILRVGFFALLTQQLLHGEACGELSSNIDSIAPVAAFLKERIIDSQLRQALSGVDDETMVELDARLERVVTAYLQHKPHGTSPLKLDTRPVEQARKALAEKSAAPRAFVMLLGYVAGKMTPEAVLEPGGLLPGGASLVGLFTRDGCSAIDQLEVKRKTREWFRCVLASEEDIDWEKEYPLMYEAAWLEFAKRVALELRFPEPAPGNPTAALQGAQDAIAMLVDGERSLLIQFFQKVGDSQSVVDVSAKEKPSGLDREVNKTGIGRAINRVDRIFGDQLKGLCEMWRRFEGFPEVIEAESKEDVALKFKNYQAALTALRSRLIEISRNTAPELKALELVRETMNASGELFRLSIAREEFFKALGDSTGSKVLWSGLSDEGRRALTPTFTTWDQSLAKLERNILDALLPLAGRSIQENWTNTILSQWRHVQYTAGADLAGACKQIDEFMKKELDPFAVAQFDPFYRSHSQRTCELLVFQDRKLAIRDDACAQLRNAREFRFACPDGGGGAPPPDPAAAVSFSMDNFPRGVAAIRFDDGQSVLEFNNVTGRCVPLSEPSSGRVILTFITTTQGRDRFTLGETLDEVIRRPGASVAGRTARVPLRPSELPRTAAGVQSLSVVLAKPFVPPPPAGKFTTASQLMQLKLPETLVSP